MISASKMGKFKMLVQVVTVALLIVSSVAGKPPVGNFGRPFPAIAVLVSPGTTSGMAASLRSRADYLAATGRCCSIRQAEQCFGW